MNHRLHTTTTKFRRTLILGVVAGLAFAHGGFEHVLGTVAKIDHDTLTVKTAKGDVDVKLNEKTEITSNDQKFAASAMKPGMRVVVDVPEGSKEKIAHSVKVGVQTAAHDHAAEGHK